MENSLTSRIAIYSIYYIKLIIIKKNNSNFFIIKAAHASLHQ